MNNPMVAFKHKLLSWSAHIKRVAYLEDLKVSDNVDGFTLTGLWKNGGSYTKQFSSSHVLDANQRPRLRVCRFRDEFISEVLHARGV